MKRGLVCLVLFSSPQVMVIAEIQILGSGELTRECELICQIGVNPIQDEGHYVSLSPFKASVLGKFKLFYFLLLTSSKIMII